MEEWLNAMGGDPDEEPEQKVKKQKYKVDMFKEILPALDAKDKAFYSMQSPERQAAIEESMWMIMRNMSSTSKNSEHHVLLVNDLVNSEFSLFTKKARQNNPGHPELQWMLLAMCGFGNKQHHPFIRPPKGLRKNKLQEAILNHYPLLKDSDLELLMSINTDDDLKEFFKENGYDDDTIADLFKGK